MSKPDYLLLDHLIYVDVNCLKTGRQYDEAYDYCQDKRGWDPIRSHGPAPMEYTDSEDRVHYMDVVTFEAG